MDFDIRNYSDVVSTDKAYNSNESYTSQVRNFVKYLHDFLPILEQEFKDIAERAKTKPCKAFKDKMKSLASIYQAEKDLYYWYIENLKSKTA